MFWNSIHSMILLYTFFNLRMNVYVYMPGEKEKV